MVFTDIVVYHPSERVSLSTIPKHCINDTLHYGMFCYRPIKCEFRENRFWKSVKQNFIHVVKIVFLCTMILNMYKHHCEVPILNPYITWQLKGTDLDF